MSWEVDVNVANGIALVGSATAIVMWMAPIRDVWTADYSIYKMQSTENVATAFGFVAGTFNCILWNMFASTRLDVMLLPFIVNCVGFALNISFVLCYYWYGEEKARRETRSQLFMMVLVTAFSIIFWVVEKNNNVVGYFAAFVNVLMLFGPLAAAGEVIRNRSSKGMSLFPMIMTLLSATVWFGYGLYIKIIPSMIPNALGMIFGVMQLLLYAWAKRQERKQIDTEILDEDFQPVMGEPPLIAGERRRAPSLTTYIAEGP